MHKTSPKQRQEVLSLCRDWNCTSDSFFGGGGVVKEYRRGEVHVDLCTNRCLLDNSFRQSHPHNPFLKHRNQPEKIGEWAWWTHVNPPNQHTQTKRQQKTRNQIWKWRQTGIQRIEHAEGKGGRASRELCQTQKGNKTESISPFFLILNRRKEIRRATYITLLRDTLNSFLNFQPLLQNQNWKLATLSHVNVLKSDLCEVRLRWVIQTSSLK